MKLHSLISTENVQLLGTENPEIVDVVRSSTEVKPGALFCALVGAKVDGRVFISDAIQCGARAVLVHEPIDSCPVPQVIAQDPRLAMARLSNRVHGNPLSRLKMIGVTGTNGKSTVTGVVHQALEHLGYKTGLSGTISNVIAGKVATASLTTPDSDDLARMGKQLVQEGHTHFVMEVSSHALIQKRVHGAQFEVAAFTNLSHDHLDYHNTMEDYFLAKEQLFTALHPKHAVVMIKDAWGKRLAQSIRALPETQLLECGDINAELNCIHAVPLSSGTEMHMVLKQRRHTMHTSLIGGFNMENLMVAFGILISLGVRADDALQALSHAKAPRGRMETIALGDGKMGVVDYAHTPDALRSALHSLREMLQKRSSKAGRLWVVFGCGGNRDQGKRAHMGQVAAELADEVMMTSDNPRDEDPEVILDAIEEGVRAHRTVGYHRITDRSNAIAFAVGLLKPHDVLLIAGKGHETCQIIGKESRPFDDRAELLRFAKTKDTP